MGQALYQSRAASSYYKVGQEILQKGAGNLLQCGALVTIKMNTYYQFYKNVEQVLKSWTKAMTDWGR